MSIGNAGIGTTLHVVDMVILFVIHCYGVDQFTDKNLVILLHGCGPGSVVGIATGYGLDGPGIESRWGRDFLHLSRPALGPTQPPLQ